jgi:hypothetical protein
MHAVAAGLLVKWCLTGLHRVLPGFHRQAGQEWTWHRSAENYLNGGNWCIIAEVESGKRSDRPAVDKALAAARVRQVPLVVARLDRLTRSAPFLTRLLEAGVDVRFADLPMIEGATCKSALLGAQASPGEARPSPDRRLTRGPHRIALGSRQPAVSSRRDQSQQSNMGRIAGTSNKLRKQTLFQCWA